MIHFIVHATREYITQTIVKYIRLVD